MITIKIHGVIQNREYELQASSIEEIKQQVVLLWQTINTSLTLTFIISDSQRLD